jgi:uncharacterized protein YegP (UPF0339 family)
MHFYVYTDAARPSLWRWTLFAANGRKLANSGESYNRYDDCVRAIDLVAGSDGAPVRHSQAALARLRRLRRIGSSEF